MDSKENKENLIYGSTEGQDCG